MMNTAYGNVYVAQIAMGANMNQAIKAITEAEAYDGPSLIIAYATCINHGIKGGLSNPMSQMKKAVECGYWHLWRYNPELKSRRQESVHSGPKETKFDLFRDFINTETRYTSLAKLFPEKPKNCLNRPKTEQHWKIPDLRGNGK